MVGREVVINLLIVAWFTVFLGTSCIDAVAGEDPGKAHPLREGRLTIKIGTLGNMFHNMNEPKFKPVIAKFLVGKNKQKQKQLLGMLVRGLNKITVTVRDLRIEKGDKRAGWTLGKAEILLEGPKKIVLQGKDLGWTRDLNLTLSDSSTDVFLNDNLVVRDDGYKRLTIRFSLKSDRWMMDKEEKRNDHGMTIGFKFSIWYNARGELFGPSGYQACYREAMRLGKWYLREGRYENAKQSYAKAVEVVKWAPKDKKTLPATALVDALDGVKNCEKLLARNHGGDTD